ncbi:hypothetical protein LOD99_9883 [Oopsacas minuta]|uniref:Ras guanyl-releasing protein 3 n=1 Tax=Oopsacas minuta TaxID=111878 RepID=A0AAV7KPM5_9METZ|nr:hypothetical protein LOD99_9883 [Oopsacas minuta]
MNRKNACFVPPISSHSNLLYDTTLRSNSKVEELCINEQQNLSNASKYSPATTSKYQILGSVVNVPVHLPKSLSQSSSSKHSNTDNSVLVSELNCRPSSQTLSFSSISSGSSTSEFLSNNYLESNVQAKGSISPTSFKCKLNFWEEKLKPTRPTDYSHVNPVVQKPCFNSPYSSLKLRLKRSSYCADSPHEDIFHEHCQDSNFYFNASQMDDNYGNSKNTRLNCISPPPTSTTCNNVQIGLYVANSMREAKMQSPIDSLILRIIHHFSSPVHDVIDSMSTTPYSFFLSYKWICIAPDVLACKLRLLFTYQLCYSPEGNLKPLSLLQLATPKQKLLVTQTFRYWIRLFPEDFPPNSLVLDVMHSLKVVMKKENMTHLLSLLELQYFDTFSYNRKLSLVTKNSNLENNSWNSNYIVPEAFEILKVSPAELAKIIIWMEYSLFLEIPFDEFRHYTKMQNSTETPHIQHSIKESNSVAMWVKSSILNVDAPDERALIIEKFIDVANETRKLHAFQTLMSLIGALNSGCVCQQRLTLSWSLVPKERIRIYEEMSNLLTVKNNYCSYRNELEHIKKQEKNFYFPILGVLFKDLIQLDAKSNTIDTGRQIEINEAKLILVAKTIETWRNSQNSTLPKFPNLGQVELVKAAIQLCSIIDEDELYKKSFLQEPASIHLGDVPLKENEIFSQFIKNFDKEKIDPAVVKLHVKAMTRAIFSAYDKNHNGYLTELEFVSIKKNFPFIKNFSELDKNKDGFICEDELYVFLFTSLGILRNFFTHDFKEFHEYHPAVCSHCKSIMWCPIEAACKCRDCDIICHKQCRQKLVAECKPNILNLRRHKVPKDTCKRTKLLAQTLDRDRHHSATELTECCVAEKVSLASNRDATCESGLLSTSDFPSSEFSNTCDDKSKLCAQNDRLTSQLSTALSIISQLKSENRSLLSELAVVKAQLYSSTHDLQLNNFELQRQFSNVRDATGEFLLQQFALINTSKSQSYV